MQSSQHINIELYSNCKHSMLSILTLLGTKTNTLLVNNNLLQLGSCNKNRTYDYPNEMVKIIDLTVLCTGS